MFAFITNISKVRSYNQSNKREFVSAGRPRASRAEPIVRRLPRRDVGTSLGKYCFYNIIVIKYSQYANRVAFVTLKNSFFCKHYGSHKSAGGARSRKQSRAGAGARSGCRTEGASSARRPRTA